MSRTRTRILTLAAVGMLVMSGCATVIEATATRTGHPSGSGFVGYQNGGPTISTDGRFVVFTGPRSAGDATSEAYRHDNSTGETVRVSEWANGTPAGGFGVAVGGTGRFVAFVTNAALVAGDTNAAKGFGADLYLRDMQTGVVTRESLRPDGSQFPSDFFNLISSRFFLSDDARYLVFTDHHEAGRTFSEDVYVRDRTLASTTAVVSGYLTLGGVSGDGLHIGIDPHDTCLQCPSYAQGYVRDWVAATDHQLGTCAAGGVMALSRAGRFVAAQESSSVAGPNCRGGVHRFDRTTDSSVAVSVAPGAALGAGSFPSMSRDGARVVFGSGQAFSPHDTNAVGDVYVKDLETGDLDLVSANAWNVVGDGESRLPWISADGNYVVLTSDATNLVGGDTDGANDVFTVSARRPTISSVAPTSVARSTAGAVVTVTASGLAPGATALIRGSGVSISAVDAVGPHQLRLTLTVSGVAATGARDVVIVNPGAYGTSSGWCFGCLTIT